METIQILYEDPILLTLRIHELSELSVLGDAAVLDDCHTFYFGQVLNSMCDQDSSLCL